MKSREFKRWLAAQGCSFETKPGRSGHLIVRVGERRAELPMHGSRKELRKSTVEKIKKDLGLK